MLSGHGDQRFGDDDGRAAPAVTAALTAFAAGTGTEHAALTALSLTRLLVPLVATVTVPDPAPESDAGQAADGGEKTSEMALPTLIGRDGRTAIPAFTSLAALARWDPAARPVPVAAGRVWQAAVAQDSAVVVDVAGPVPLAVEGFRLAALAIGEPVPPPHEDSDVVVEVAAAVTAAATAAGLTPDQVPFALRPGRDDCDLVIELCPAPPLAEHAEASLATGVGQEAIARLGHRLPRGIALSRC